MTERTLSTTLIWHDSRGEECAVDVTVTYACHCGCAATLVDPGEPDSVEIVKIKPADGEPVPNKFFYDDELLAECMEHWRDDQIAAAEHRAEQRRDDLMMERGR